MAVKGTKRDTTLFLSRLVAVMCFMSLPFASSKLSGAPGAACVDLTPQHGSNSPQTSPSPFTISFSPSSFSVNGTLVTVTLSGGVFKGFLLTAQYEDSCVDQSLMPGVFTPVANTKMTCNNGAVTHSSPNTLSPLSFQWTPPTTSRGNIRFRATFVQSFTTFWVNVKASDVLVDSAVGAGNSTCDPSTTPQPAPTGTIQKDPGCGTTKGCYSDCSGSSCGFLMTWAPGPSADNVLITMSSRIGNAQNRYFAFGLSNDQEMGDDSVNYCINAANGVYSSYNDGKSNVQLTNSQDGVSSITVSFDSGVLTCSFTRTTAGGANGRLFALDKPYTILWAEGPGSAAGAGRHEQIPISSSMAVSLQDFTADITGGVDFPLVKAHGSMMIAAWICFASIGIVLARYFKDVWKNQTWLDQKIWFQVHRTCMVLCLLATVAAFIIIFVEAEGYSDIDDQAEGIKKAHPILGIIVTVLTITNPIMALFRPHPGTKNRPIFNWLHWAVGTVGYTLAVVTVFFGMEMDKAGAPDYTFYILVAFVVWQALVQIILEILQCQGRKNDSSGNKYEMTDISGGSPPAASPPQGQSTLAKRVLLAIHIIVVIAFTVALIIVLNVVEEEDDD
ncbi:putative ferric-chelate reductase 1 isoform X2 [Babylonia areolata]|uniref:putative ferric-chelate reductase 1 isoform X2 n=1 Tax=Babylonia areolata TaxID=304850 RepID=UPI003FD69FA2